MEQDVRCNTPAGKLAIAAVLKQVDCRLVDAAMQNDCSASDTFLAPKDENLLEHDDAIQR